MGLAMVRPPLLGLIATVALLSSSSCVFPPSLGEGKVRCGAMDFCPPGYYCHHDHLCWTTQETRTADLSMSHGDAISSVPYDMAGDFANCTTLQCTAQQCGMVPDGCGKLMDCGNNCPAGETCGGGTDPHACGCPTQVMCDARNCGTALNNCGSSMSCGPSCAPGLTCGGGGPNICGVPTCNPMPPPSCTGKRCALLSDGCSNVMWCLCPAGKVCTAVGPCP